MSIELGGFAETPEVIDGTEEDFNAFNWCLACDYYEAVVGEDFDSLGEVLNDVYNWHTLMYDVCTWMNYDGERGKNMKDELLKLYNGTILTYNNRTFIEAAREHGWFNLAYGLVKDLEEKEKQLQLTRKHN